jgi:hypothetical protein
MKLGTLTRTVSTVPAGLGSWVFDPTSALPRSCGRPPLADTPLHLRQAGSDGDLETRFSGAPGIDVGDRILGTAVGAGRSGSERGVEVAAGIGFVLVAVWGVCERGSLAGVDAGETGHG